MIVEGDGFSYALENRLVKKLDLMIERCITDKVKKDAVIINEGGEGEGKCLKKGSKVLMADGSWKNIEDIKEGDLVISPQQDGSHVFAKVIGTTSWFCNKPYEVRQLNKNQKVLYVCSYNHSIPINKKIYPRTKGIRLAKNSYWALLNMEAEDYSKYSKSRKKNMTSISSFKIDKFLGRNNCEIEPYTLGVYLGDGTFSSLKKGNSTRKHVSISNINNEIIGEINKYYPIHSVKSKNRNSVTNFFSTCGEFAQLLTKYGLEGKRSGDKFIPTEAMLSDSDYRTKLLAGLIDTDCYYHQGGYTFTSKSKRLIEDIRELVYSLGGRCGDIREIEKHIKSYTFVGTYYSVCAYLGDIELPLKKDYKKKDNGTFYISPNRISIDVIKTSPCMVYGFTIDSPSQWFVTDNWMVTHNSNTSVCEAYYIKKKTGRDVHLFFRLEPLIEFAKRTENKIILWDEPSLDSLSTDQLRDINRDLLRLLMTARKKRHFFIINMTKFWKFSEYVVVDRSLGMIHMYSRKEIMPGRFCYIKKRNLEQLWNDYTKSKKRNYNKLSSFRGSFPDIMQYHFDKMGIYIGDKANATYDDYEKLKDEAIESIGQKFKGMSKKEVKLLLECNTLKRRLVRIQKDLGINQDKFARSGGMTSRSLREWAKIPLNETNLLGKPGFEASEGADSITKGGNGNNFSPTGGVTDEDDLNNGFDDEENDDVTDE